MTTSALDVLLIMRLPLTEELLTSEELVLIFSRTSYSYLMSIQLLPCMKKLLSPTIQYSVTFRWLMITTTLTTDAAHFSVKILAIQLSVSHTVNLPKIVANLSLANFVPTFHVALIFDRTFILLRVLLLFLRFLLSSIRPLPTFPPLLRAFLTYLPVPLLLY